MNEDTEAYYSDIDRIFKKAVKKARRKTMRKGLPIVYVKQGTIHYKHSRLAFFRRLLNQN